MNQKGFHVLSEFVNHFPSEIINCVISSQDKAVQHDYNEEIKNLCENHAIQYYDRENMPSLSSDYCFAVGWRWMLNLDVPLIIFHDSLLPKYRGFNPLVTCLINGDNKIGVTALFADQRYDTGDIVSQQETAIEYPIKIQTAIEKVCHLYFSLIRELTENIIQGRALVSKPQLAEEATYSLWRDDLDYQIDWHKSATYLKRFIDAVGYPYKGAYTFIQNKKIFVLDAESLPDVKIENREPGKVIFMEEGNPVVVCGSGLLKLTAIIDDQQQSLIPLNNFRVRFL